MGDGPGLFSYRHPASAVHFTVGGAAALIPDQCYTEHARDAFAVAREEASRTGSRLLNAEHLLLGVLYHRESVASRLLEWAKIPPEGLWLHLPQGETSSITCSEVPPSLRTQEVLRLASLEAQHWGDEVIGTAHLLLGIVREEENRGAAALAQRGLNIYGLRLALLEFCAECRRKPKPGRARQEQLPVRSILHSTICPEEVAWDLLPPREVCRRAPVPRSVQLARSWLLLQAFGCGLLALLLLLGMSFAGPILLLPTAALLWQAAWAAAAYRPLGAGARVGWVWTTALLFATTLTLVTLPVGLVQHPWLMPGAIISGFPLTLPLIFHTGAIVLLPLLFRRRGWFGIGEREGWRTLVREGAWVLGGAIVLQLATLGWALRDVWQSPPAP